MYSCTRTPVSLPTLPTVPPLVLRGKTPCISTLAESDLVLASFFFVSWCCSPPIRHSLRIALLLLLEAIPGQVLQYFCSGMRKAASCHLLVLLPSRQAGELQWLLTLVHVLFLELPTQWTARPVPLRMPILAPSVAIQIFRIRPSIQGLPPARENRLGLSYTTHTEEL